MDLVYEPAALHLLKDHEIRLLAARVIRLVQDDHHPGPAVRQELDLFDANDDTLLIVRQRLRRRSEKVEQILTRRAAEKVAYEVLGEVAGDTQRVSGVGTGKELMQGRNDVSGCLCVGGPAGRTNGVALSIGSATSVPKIAAISSIEAGSITHWPGSGADGYPAGVPVCAIVESAGTRESNSIRIGMPNVRSQIRGTAISLSTSFSTGPVGSDGISGAMHPIRRACRGWCHDRPARQLLHVSCRKATPSGWCLLGTVSNPARGSTRSY
jgi:hypothetical protein